MFGRIFVDWDVPLSNGDMLRDAVHNRWKEAGQAALSSGSVNPTPADDEQAPDAHLYTSR